MSENENANAILNAYARIREKYLQDGVDKYTHMIKQATPVSWRASEVKILERKREKKEEVLSNFRKLKAANDKKKIKNEMNLNAGLAAEAREIVMKNKEKIRHQNDGSTREINSKIIIREGTFGGRRKRTHKRTLRKHKRTLRKHKRRTHRR
jgi:hypothetical protein